MKQMMTEKAVYPIDKLGYCLIFNIESFQNNERSTRDGTNIDKTMIETTFDSFGYVVNPVQDPSEARITAEMKTSMLKSNKWSKCFFSFLLPKKNPFLH